MLVDVGIDAGHAGGDLEARSSRLERDGDRLGEGEDEQEDEPAVEQERQLVGEEGVFAVAPVAAFIVVVVVIVAVTEAVPEDGTGSSREGSSCGGSSSSRREEGRLEV